MRAEPHSRPLSGEILTAARPARAVRAADDIVDVEFVTIGEAPPVEPARTISAAEPLPGLDMLRRAESRRQRFGAPGQYGFWLIGLTLVAASFWIAGGHALVSR